MPPGVLSEGQTVTIVVHESDDESFELSEADEKSLLASASEIRRGESVDGWQLLHELEQQRS